MTTDATQVAHLKVTSDRCYHGLHYIEGAPFRIPFWTIATNIDPMEGVRRLRFADELVAAWNTRTAAATLTAQVEALTAENEALRGALAEQVGECFDERCEMCLRHEALLASTSNGGEV